MNLLELNEKIKDELDIKSSENGEETPEEDDLDSKKDTSKSRIRIENDSKITGIIRNLDYDIRFTDLADRLKEEVPGVTITRDKAKKIFNVVKDMIGF
jgi:hypothetical protein